MEMDVVAVALVLVLESVLVPVVSPVAVVAAVFVVSEEVEVFASVAVASEVAAVSEVAAGSGVDVSFAQGPWDEDALIPARLSKVSPLASSNPYGRHGQAEVIVPSSKTA